MPLAFLFDEQLRGPLWGAILRHNATSNEPLDVVRVGDPADLALGSDDAAILQWAEGEGRILVTEDRHTMPDRLAEHLASGRHCPGVFMVRFNMSRRELVECLWLAAYAGAQKSFAT
jgi:hypothetical protein